MASNNAATAKPVSVTGAIYVGEVNSSHLPTDPTTAMSTLSAYFKSVGYISDDGVTNAYSVESEEIKCWGGTVVASPVTGKTDNWSFKMISPRNVTALKLIYGDNNVTEVSGAITAKATGDEFELRSFVIDALVDGVATRIVIPKGKVSEVSDIVYKDDEALGYEVTISALDDGNDETHITYFAA